MLRYNQYSFILLSDSVIQLVQSNAEKVDEMHKIKLLTDDIIRQMYNQTRTVKVRTALCLVLVRPNRQISDSIFYKIPDRILTADRIETDRIRTDSGHNPDKTRHGQDTDNLILVIF